MTNMTAIARIEKTKINPNRKITADVRKKLVEMLEHEFNEQRIKHREQEDDRKKEIMDKVKKQSGWDKYKDELDELDAKIETIKFQMEKKKSEMYNNTGMKSDGTHIRNYERVRYSKKAVSKGEAIEIKLNKAINQTDAMNIKRKLVARMWLTETIGEATMILNAVMGNGLIPTL